MSVHRAVLLDEALAGLRIAAGGRYVDGTFGRGGHAQAILAALGPAGRLLALDKDPEAVEYARTHLAEDSRFAIEQGSFAMLQSLVEARGWKRAVDGLLLDLGVSSPQLDDARRGFSFLHDGPLDCRMDPGAGISAAEWLASAGSDEIAQVLKDYGEERHAKRIARASVQAREAAPVRTTRQLADIISAANPAWEKHKHPATRSFQAIRIFINHELDDLQQCLQQAIEILAPGGRLVVISFHSLEDRIVKRFIRNQARGGELPPGLPVPASAFSPTLRPVGKVVRSSAAEIDANPRARSAVMRVAERCA